MSKENSSATKASKKTELSTSQSTPSAEELTHFLTGLGRASTAMRQIGGIFTLLQHLANGSHRVSHERRLDAVLGALNEVGAIGDSLIGQAFEDVVNVEHELKKYTARVADKGKAVAQ